MAQIAKLIEIERTADYASFGTAPMSFAGAQLEVNLEIWGEDELEISVAGKDAIGLLNAGAGFMLKLEQHLGLYGIVVANVTSRESGAQSQDRICFTAKFTTLSNIVEVEDEDLCGDCSPRFEAILNQDRSLMLWLHTGAAGKPDIWSLGYSALEDHAWLEDNTLKTGEMIMDVGFASFEHAMKAIMDISRTVSASKGFAEV